MQLWGIYSSLAVSEALWTRNIRAEQLHSENNIENKEDYIDVRS